MLLFYTHFSLLMMILCCFVGFQLWLTIVVYCDLWIQACCWIGAYFQFLQFERKWWRVCSSTICSSTMAVFQLGSPCFSLVLRYEKRYLYILGIYCITIVFFAMINEIIFETKNICKLYGKKRMIIFFN